MSHKHTPGPWVVGEPHPINACAYVRDDKGYEVAALYYCSVGGGIGDDGIWTEQPNRDANAHLIAAAPDMLDVLEQCAEYFDKFATVYHDQDGLVANEAMQMLTLVMNVIAQAEGRL